MNTSIVTTGNLRGRSAVVLVVLLCLVIFTGATSWLAPMALLPFIASGLGSSVSVVGEISSGSIFLTAFLAVLIGTLVRRYGYRRLYATGLCAMILGSAVMAVAPNVWAVLAAALLTSFANAIIVPVALAMVATELSTDTGRRAMSYQIACLFLAVAVGMPGCVFLAHALGWRAAFVALAVIPALLLPVILRVIPVNALDPDTRVDLVASLRQYREMLGDRSLASIYLFLVLYVVCSAGSGAYAAALMISRGFDAEELGLAFAVVGVAFVLSSVVAGEALGKLRVDLRFIVVVGALLFCLTRGAIYLAPLGLTAMIALFGLASLVDGTVAVALRALVASYEVRDRALSMVLFAACESFGQAIGGVTGGLALAVSGYPGIGALVLVVGLLAIWLPIASRGLVRPVAVAIRG